MLALWLTSIGDGRPTGHTKGAGPAVSAPIRTGNMATRWLSVHVDEICIKGDTGKDTHQDTHRGHGMIMGELKLRMSSMGGTGAGASTCAIAYARNLAQPTQCHTRMGPAVCRATLPSGLKPLSRGRRWDSLRPQPRRWLPTGLPSRPPASAFPACGGRTPSCSCGRRRGGRRRRRCRRGGCRISRAHSPRAACRSPLRPPCGEPLTQRVHHRAEASLLVSARAVAPA